MSKVITVVGSRSADTAAILEATKLCTQLLEEGYLLRSGGAKGMDRAVTDAYLFHVGMDNMDCIKDPEIYIPWKNFNGGSLIPELEFNLGIVCGTDPDARLMASRSHPAWGNCSEGVRKLHTRNVHQLLGLNLDKPSDVLLYWAETDYNGKPKGGTAMAVALADLNQIPTINMAHPDWLKVFNALVGREEFPPAKYIDPELVKDAEAELAQEIHEPFTKSTYRTHVGDMFHIPNDCFVVTTNGYVTKSGNAVMRRGCAKRLAELFPDVKQVLGKQIKDNGNITQILRMAPTVVALPVKPAADIANTALSNVVTHARGMYLTGGTIPGYHCKAELNIIRKSIKDLVTLADAEGWQNVVMPRPGCGFGELSWHDVKPILDDLLDERFIVCHFQPS